MTSHNNNSSLHVPLMDSDDSSSSNWTEEGQSMASSSSSSSSSSKQTTILFLGVSMAALLWMSGACHYHGHHGGHLVDHDGDFESSYGVDVSWPIHGAISDLNDHRPADQRFAPGSRHQAYVKHIRGCRQHYIDQGNMKAARTCDTYEFDRMLMAKRQPQSMQNYTELGFQKIRAPPRVAQLVQEFWEQNKDKQVPEAWPEGNIYLNHWDAPSSMVSVDDTGLRGSGYRLKTNIWGAARDTISEWTGGQDITPVSMYGIRVYHNNSVLVPHVDRLPLVASAMINVAQDVEEDWPMEVYSHKTGMAHNVTLHPGDMLLFESHSTMHGRPFPLKGKFYAMLFMHFEPTGQTPLREEQKVGVEEQYRQAVMDSVGGQSSSEQSKLLPPYIRRFSPEEEHWQRENPQGWQAPASYPSSYRETTTQNNTTKEEEKDNQQSKEQEQPQELQAARDGDMVYWVDAMNHAQGEARSKLVNRRDAQGWQPIHESATNGKLNVVNLLLRNGANINARTNGGRGGTPLFLAQQKLGVDHPIVAYLVERGALSIPPDYHREEL